MLEAYEGCWCKVPHVKRLIMKGDADFAGTVEGRVAEKLKRDPRLLLLDTRHASIFWVKFADQWDPKSVWADKRVRLPGLRLSRYTHTSRRPKRYATPSSMGW